MYVRRRFTTPKMGSDTSLSMFRLCSCGTKPQRSQKSSFRDDVIMGTPMSS